MIQKLEVNGVHLEVNKKLHDYVLKKIGKLDHYMPRHARMSAHAEVFLKETTVKKKKQCMCEVVLHLPKETITIKESTMNIFAAVDIVEAKLKNQIKNTKKLTVHSVYIDEYLPGSAGLAKATYSEARLENPLSMLLWMA